MHNLKWQNVEMFNAGVMYERAELNFVNVFANKQ